MSKEKRKESTIPVQTRISMIDLAKMDNYWLEVENVKMRSMSQLISWTFSAMVDIIEGNRKMPDRVKSVEDAHRHLTIRDLYQRGMKARSQSRIAAALRFESLRDHGIDPQHAATRTYNVIHSEHTMQPYEDDPVIVKRDFKIDWDEVDKQVAESKRVEREERLEKDLDNAKECGVLIEDAEFIKERQEIDRKIIERENAPVDLSQLNIVEE